MAKRSCANCGKDKDIEGGRICEKGHFICKTCVNKDSDFFFSRPKTKCPVCGTKLK